jgi:hypothetical protein
MYLRPMLPTNTAAVQALDEQAPREQIAMKAIDGANIEHTGEFAQFAEAKELLAHYRAMRFEDLRWKVCGILECGGC